MIAKPDCVVCMLKQALAIGRMSGLSETEVEKTFYQLIRELPDRSMNVPPPELMEQLCLRYADASGVADPYSEIKKQSNREAMKLLPDLEARVEASEHPLAEALCLAIAGNLIDFGAHASLDLEKTLDEILNQPLFKTIESGKEFDSRLFQLHHFLKDLESAEKIIYLGDNAGEIVFDRVLIETLNRLYPDKSVTYVTRGGPALNDVLLQDAYETGIDSAAEVIDSGSSTAGTILSRCSKDFLDRLHDADLVIAKGQGNYESLSGEKMPAAYFLFRIKCLAVAEAAGGPVGTLVLLKNTVSGDNNE